MLGGCAERPAAQATKAPDLAAQWTDGQGIRKPTRMPNVVFISPKGGAGKTTAALALALGLVERGHRVALIDSDPNKPLVRWAALPNRSDAISVHPAPTVQDIRDAVREAQRRAPEWTILDTEGTERGGAVL